MSRAIAYYFSLLSPWAYLGHTELGRIAERRSLTVDYRPVNLVTLFPETGGLPLGKRHPSRQAYRLVEMQRWREARDLPLVLKPRHWPFDFKLADRAALAAARSGEQAQAHAFIACAFRAVWVDERNMADPAVIGQLLAESGFDADAVLSLARSPGIEEAYAANYDSALADGVYGSPSYVLDGEVFWGQDRLELLEQALVSGRAPFSADV
ncbi:MAG: disulfide bond formation protein DsbA [Hyphomicrobiales bacterium]|nr:disulfide bond formation protein DsbA [Hyphomicrobiales bacterium]